MQDTGDDWRAERALRYRAQHTHSRPRPVAQLRKRLSSVGPTISTKHACAGALLAFLVLPCMVVQIKQYRENRLLNASEVPDASMRSPFEHRSWVMNKHDFVEVYSAKAPKTKTLEGQQLWQGDFHESKAAITRCATSQYAMVTYFCGKAAADTGAQLSGDAFLSAASVSSFIKVVEGLVNNSSSSGGEWPQLVLRFHVDEHTDKFVGHTFVVHVLPDGTFQVYQSFIGHYTLQEYLQQHGPMTQADFVNFLANITLIEAASEWGAAEDAAYRANFLVSLSSGHGKKMGPVGGPRQQQRSITMSAEVVCYAAPWPGHADESEGDYGEDDDAEYEDSWGDAAGAAQELAAA